MMSEAVQLALIVSVAPTLVAAAGLVVAMRNGRKSDARDLKIEQIHTLTNDNLSKVTEALRIEVERTKGAERVVSTMREATAEAGRVADRAMPPPAPEPPVK